MQLRSGSRYVLNDELRNEVARYKHDICTINDLRRLSQTMKIITVGDVTTENARKVSIPIFLQVVDLKSKRGKEGEFQHEEGSVQVYNEPGTLSGDLFAAIERAISSNTPTRIEIIGEEDLAVIPIIFYSDTDTVVAYGIPDIGMACIEIDEEIKSLVEGLISRMVIT